MQIKKVYIDGRNLLDNELIEKHSFIELVNSDVDADIIISQSTVKNIDLIHKTIYIAAEPPRTEHRIWCYSNFNKFKFVVCRNAKNLNEINFTPDDSTQYYPTKPDAYIQERKDLTLKNRGIFFAGIMNTYENIRDECGGYSITHLRRIMAEYFSEKLPASKFMGIGWNGQTEKAQRWRKDKHDKIKEYDVDFVLALENTIHSNYISEKIWDGINSDRVTLYLGDPNIEKHIPLNCFIDLRPYYNLETREFDLNKLYNRLISLTQKEYNEIIYNSREFRKTCEGKHSYYRNLLTEKIIKFIVYES